MENKTHELKTWPEYFEKVVSGEKTFEIRNNDRKFEVGDILLLKEWEPQWYNSVTPSEIAGEYTGRSVKVKVTYILPKPKTGQSFGIMNGHCLMAIQRCDKAAQGEVKASHVTAANVGEITEDELEQKAKEAIPNNPFPDMEYPASAVTVIQRNSWLCGYRQALKDHLNRQK